MEIANMMCYPYKSSVENSLELPRSGINHWKANSPNKQRRPAYGNQRSREYSPKETIQSGKYSNGTNKMQM
jgi:hypothetical protein